MTLLSTARLASVRLAGTSAFSSPVLRAAGTKKNLFALQMVANKSTLVLVRHGESEWNLENKFTGWYDCALSPKGHEEVIEAGQLIKTEGIKFSVAHTSLLKRAIRTLWHVMEETDLMWGR